MNKQIANNLYNNQTKGYVLRSRMKSGTQKPVYGRTVSIFKMDITQNFAATCNHPETDLTLRRRLSQSFMC